MIYLLRHGLDDENYIGGHSDVDLIPEGIAQVERSASFIEDLKIDRIITSDVKRALSSAEIVRSKLGKDIPLIVDPRLRELDKGLLTGRLRSSLTEEEEAICEMKDIYMRYPNGESMQDMYDRVKYLMDSEYFIDKESSLIVTHRGIINMVYFMFNNEPLTMNKKKFGVDHASVHEMDLDKKLIKRIF